MGYLTVNETGLVQVANLTAATLLGVARSVLVGQPLTRFILLEDEDIYLPKRLRDFLLVFDQDGKPVGRSAWREV